ncbi:helix-turn-helix domain-containing protein [Streptomyces sp. NPDC014734]|uniref:helix-turn-helix domain-containing protein n=1 Tax=Streptomyces sp. NPDC014734 TaxID=3364886 RepID=UPI0036FCF2AE
MCSRIFGSYPSLVVSSPGCLASHPSRSFSGAPGETLLDTAARKGNVGGRPSVMDDDKLAVARARYAKGESVTAIAKTLSIGRTTLYRHLGESA